MEKRLILVLFLLVLFGCTDKYKFIEEKKEGDFLVKYYKRKSLPDEKIEEFYLDTKKLARVYYKNESVLYGKDSFLFSNGRIQIIKEYKNGKLDGDFVGYFSNGDTMVIQKYSQGNIIYQKGVYSDGVISSLIENGISKSYFHNGTPNSFCKFYSKDSIYGYIGFTEQGKVEEVLGKLDFLSKEDSLLILNSWGKDLSELAR